MVSYDTFKGGRIVVLNDGSFAMNFDGQGLVYMTRDQLRSVVSAAWQALNTSAEELSDTFGVADKEASRLAR